MLLLGFAALTAAPVTTAAQPQPKSSVCPSTSSYLAGAESLYRGKPLTPRRLTELPDANLYLTVYRRIDGCEAPIVVKYRVSGR
jgi:hypothetical protein